MNVATPSSRTVWKFRLDVRDAASWVITGEIAAQVVAVRGASPTDIDVWVEMDPAAEMKAVHFFVTGTGQPVPSGHFHVGTAFCEPFVWHVYQRRWDILEPMA